MPFRPNPPFPRQMTRFIPLDGRLMWPAPAPFVRVRHGTESCEFDARVYAPWLCQAPGLQLRCFSRSFVLVVLASPVRAG